MVASEGDEKKDGDLVESYGGIYRGRFVPSKLLFSVEGRSSYKLCHREDY